MVIIYDKKRLKMKHPEKYKCNIFTKELIIYIAKTKQKEIENMTYADFQKGGYKDIGLCNHKMLLEKFKSIQNFYNEIGFSFKNKKITISKKEIIRIGKIYKKELEKLSGFNFKQGKHKKYGLPSMSTIMLKFDNFKNFLNTIGIKKR